MKIYVVIVDDRHADADAEVFADLDDAIAFAKTEVWSNAADEEDIEIHNPPPPTWLWYATYSGEGDCAWVIEKELQ